MAAAMIHARMASTAEMLELWSDEAFLTASLRFERELAAAQAEHAVISEGAAHAIATACHRFDRDGIADKAAHAGTFAIPLVTRLRADVSASAPALAAWVHFGASNQDVADTAMVLQAQRARALIEGELAALTAALVPLARRHARTAARGRTLLQPADPISLGLRFAGWIRGLDEAGARLGGEAAQLERVQYGGAVGSLAALGAKGPAVRASLARRLGLADGPAWHARRGAVAGLGGALAILTGAAAKMARDVSLLMQAELAELAEPKVSGRGGSSAMPGKRNPTGCQVALSAALRAPGLAATLLGGLPQELERGLGGWQAEAPVLAELFALGHGALRAMREVAEGLEIDELAVRARVQSEAAHAATAAGTTLPAALDAAARTIDELLAHRG